MLEALGEWVEIHKEAVYLPSPSGIEIEGNAKDFLLRGDGCYYLFVHDLPMKGDANVEQNPATNPYADKFVISEPIRSVKWLDNGADVTFVSEGNTVTVCPAHYRYGENLVVRVAKIELE